MTPSRPYLVRAIHDWIVDNDLTPQIVVNAEMEGVRVPPAYVQDGKIVLNVSGSAVRNLKLGNEWVEFAARFGGTPFEVSVPTAAVMAVYARENGVGMAFQEEEPPPEGGADGGADSERAGGAGKPKLKVVK